MYLTKQLTLFKTPLSPTYENVYDDYSTYTDYENFLLNNFSHIEIDIVDDMEVGRDKSVIDKNGIFSLVVKNHSSMDIHDYNYCCFETDKNTSKPLFAFILSVDSLNDSRTSSSCRINCQLDAWTHNIFDMQGGYDVNDIECRHMIESEIVGENLIVKPYITDEEPLVLEANRPESEYRLLWARVTTGNEICAKHLTGQQVNITNCRDASTIKNSITTPVFYLPFCVVNPINGTVSTKYKTAVCQCFDGSDWSFDVQGFNGSLVRTMINNFELVGLFCSGTELISVELTYYAPFYWELDEENDRVKIYQKKITNFIPDNIAEQQVLRLCDKSGNDLFTETNFFGAGTDEIPYFMATINDLYTEQSTVSKVVSTNVNYPANISIESDGFDSRLLGRLHYYPYNYKTVIINKKENALVPSLNITNAFISITCNKTVKPMCFFGYSRNDYTIVYNEKFPLVGEGELVTTVDSLEYNKRNNGNKLLAGVIGATLGTTKEQPIMAHTIGRFPDGTTTKLATKYQAGTGLRPNIGAVVGAVGGVIAQLADSDNAFDSYKTPQINALDNFYLQDFVYIKEYVPQDNIQLYALKRKLHDFGININQRLSVREKTHFTFDYVRTNNCHLPMIGNIDDRHEIETAYDRGITKWHISGNASSEYMRTFSKNIPNMDLVQQEYYSVG